MPAQSQTANARSEPIVTRNVIIAMVAVIRARRDDESGDGSGGGDSSSKSESVIEIVIVVCVFKTFG